jgi:ankyrin repeat protein
MSVVDHLHLAISNTGFYFKIKEPHACKKDDCEHRLLEKILIILQNNTPFDTSKDCCTFSGQFSKFDKKEQEHQLFELAKTAWCNHNQKHWCCQPPLDTSQPFCRATVQQVYHQIEKIFIPPPPYSYSEPFIPFPDANHQLSQSAPDARLNYLSNNTTTTTPKVEKLAKRDALQIFEKAKLIPKHLPKIKKSLLKKTDSSFRALAEQDREEIEHMLSNYFLSPENIYSADVPFSKAGKLSAELKKSFSSLLEPSAYEKVEALLNYGIDPKSATPEGRTPLHSAVWRKNTPITKLLLERGANPNQLELTKNVSPADLADGQPEMLQMLLNYGAVPKRVMFSLYAKKISAAQLESIRIILQYSPQDSEHYGEQSGIPRSVYFHQYQNEIREELNKLFSTDLMYKQEASAESLFPLFINLGVNISQQDKWGRTALHYAVFHKNIDIVNLLMNNHASPFCQDKEGITPCDLAVEDPALLCLLLQKDSPIYEPKNSLLIGAVVKKQTESVRILLEKHINPNSANYHGETALHLAVKKKLYDIVDLLLKNQADANKFDIENCTPLFFCPTDAKLTEKLLNKGASVHHVNHIGDTPLHLAALNGCEEVMLLLLQRNASLEVVNVNGYTPFTYAANSINPGALSLLKDWQSKNTTAGQ